MTSGSPPRGGPPGRGLALRLQRAWLGRGALAVVLWPAAALFGLATALDRTLRGSFGGRSPVRLPVPVVVVGNLIAGGAGKTPTVIAIVALLRRHGWAPGIVSRGWGRANDRSVVDVRPESPAGTVGDEPLLLRRRTGVPVCVGRDRVAAARALLQRHPGVDVIVSDDGLQHRRLGRDVQVLVFDERGIGNGWLLPAGPLREPLPRHVPPRSLVLYNAPAASTPLPGHVVRRALSSALGLDDWHAGRAEKAIPIERLRGRPLLAAAGVAHPQRFFGMLEAAGLSFTALPLADHCDYAVLPWLPDTAEVVTTEKDAIKLDPRRMGATQVWVAALDFAPDAGFDAGLLALLRAPLATRRDEDTLGPDHGNSSS